MYYLRFETNAETGNAIRISTQGECISVLHQYFADKDQADALSVRLGGEERSEQLGFRFFADAGACIPDFQHKWRGGGPDKDFSVGIDAFGGILDDVDKDLLEERSVHADHGVLLAQIQM